MSEQRISEKEVRIKQTAAYSLERKESTNEKNTQEDTNVTDMQQAADDSNPGTDDLTSGGQGREDAVLDGELRENSARVGNSTATVKVVLMPEALLMTMAFHIGLTIHDLKKRFSTQLKVPAEVLQVALNGSVVEDHQALMVLGVQPNGTAQLELSSSDPARHPLQPTRPPQHYNMADVLTVRVQKEGEGYQEVVVEIERPPQQKVFLGGFRHRLTGVHFHHASVQTLPKRRPNLGLEVYSRDTQTAVVKDQAQQSSNTTSTQITTNGCYISCAEDKLVTPGNYVPAHLYHSRRLKAVITLQSYVRSWKARSLAAMLRLDRDRRLVWLEEEPMRIREEKEEQRRAERQRMRNPHNKEDFDLLYSALETWRCEEGQLINATLEGAERKAALCLLLDQESRQIASIGCYQAISRQRHRDQAVIAFLHKCAAPKRWRACDGRITQMDTPLTVHARELQDLYITITDNTSVCAEKRLNALIMLKQTVNEHGCQLTRDLVELIDREAELMTRGVKETNLEGLRMRISTLFLQYIKTPTFNPEAAKLLTVPPQTARSRSRSWQNFYLCRGCGQHLPATQLCLAVNARTATHCQRCVELKNQALQRHDLSPYRSILCRLHSEEERLNHQSKIIYLLQEADVRYLVDVVWGGRSALSGDADPLYQVLVRWDRLEDWSPWNCILLCKEEKSAHLQINNVYQAYGVVFIDAVRHKHMLARRYFSQIPVMAQYLQCHNTPTTALSNQLVSKPITMATGTLTADASATSASQQEA